jgi:drug/metabolite transporter (DMT)-like permease
MRRSQDRNIKVLGGLSLVLGSLAFVRAFSAVAQFRIEPSAAADWVDYSLGAAAIGVVHIVVGWALLCRNPRARPVIAISSLFLLVMYAGGAIYPPEYAGAGHTSRIGNVLPLVVVVANLWLTLSRRGKEALKSCLSRNYGLRE